MFKKSLVSPRNRRLASRPLEKFALSGDERNGLVQGELFGPLEVRVGTI